MDPIRFPDHRDAFLAELGQLQVAFDRMQPLVEYTARDHKLGAEGYVVVWNTLVEGGIAKGGTRVTPTVTLDEVKMLARTMALKNAAAGLPLGGAKSGIRMDPREADAKTRYVAIAKRFAPLFPENGGPFGGLGYDIGARPEFADWFIEATGMPQRFTGKTRAMGGTDYDVEGIAGLGVAVAAREALTWSRRTADGASFAVQGLGAMGAAIVRYFTAFGGRLCAVSDPMIGGSYELPEGLPPSLRAELTDRITARDYSAIQRLVEEHGRLAEESDAVLFAAVDVMFPAARQEVIHAANVDRICAGMIAEGANGPCAGDSRDRLAARGITVLPDFLANPGGIIAAYVEMTSKSADKVAEAKSSTESTIAKNVRTALDAAASLDVPPAATALYSALRRVLGA